MVGITTETPVLSKAEWMAKLSDRRESEDVKMTAMYFMQLSRLQLFFSLGIVVMLEALRSIRPS